MAAIAHNPAFAKKVGVPQSVGKDFNEADKGKKFGKGGDMKKMAKGGDMKEDMAMDKKQDVAMIKKAFKEHDSQEHKGGKGTTLKLKKGGLDMKMKMKKMAAGGMTEATMGKVKTGGSKKHGDGIAERGKTRAMMPKMGGNIIGNGPAVNTMKKGGKVKK